MLKLTIELVPAKCWGQSLYKLARPSIWRKLRKDACAKYGNKCGICKGGGRLNLHEIWQYDDQKHIQKLVGFIVLCNLCHSVKHLGRTEQISTSTLNYYEIAVKHFMKVNACNRDVFDEHKKDTFVKWRVRSQYEWKVDFGEYRKMLKQM